MTKSYYRENKDGIEYEMWGNPPNALKDRPDSSKENKMETEFSKSWNEFIESEEGKKCSEPDFGSISNKYLINRLHLAFSAGWNAKNLEKHNKMENLKEASEIVTVFYKMNESGKQLHEVLPEIQKMIDGYKKADTKVNSILTEKIKVSSK